MESESFMPPGTIRVSILIDAGPESVFAYVSDLTRHGEWSADPLKIAAIAPGPVAVGSRYRSAAGSHGVDFHTDLTVTVFEPPVRFAFRGEDATAKFLHTFTFEPSQGGTLVRRQIQFQANLLQWLTHLLVVYPVRIPSARRTLQLLKEQIELHPRLGENRDTQ